MPGFPDWGNVPSYFGGLALIVAVITMGRDGRDRRRAQAEKVAGWAEKRDDAWEVTLRNTSDLPVTRVVVWMNAGYRPASGVRLSKFAMPDGHVKPCYEASLPPGTTICRTFPVERGPVAVISLEFIDCRGVGWKRTNQRLYRTNGAWIKFKRIPYRIKVRYWRIRKRHRRLKVEDLAPPVASGGETSPTSN